MLRFKTGVAPLDEQLPHGVPAGYVVLVEGPLGTGKSFFAITIAATAAARGAPVLFFSFDTLPDEITSELERRGVPLERVIIVDCFAAPDERFSKLKSPARHRLDVIDAHLLTSKLAEFAEEFRGGVIIIDSLNEILLRSQTPASDIIRALKIFARYANSMAVVTAHTDIEEIRAVINSVKHLLDIIVELDVDPEFEEIGIYVRRMRIARARKLKVSHDWIYFEIVNNSIVEVDIKALIRALNKQVAEGLAALRQSR